MRSVYAKVLVWCFGTLLFSLVAFAMEPDRTYVVCTTIVLGVLMYSLSSSGW